MFTCIEKKLPGFYLLFLIFVSPFFASGAADSLYPPIEPLRSGYLKVSKIHQLYWEVCGNEKGQPVIVLHGGPGGGATPVMRRFFDPEHYKILLFDQRGAGRSLPKAEWKDNTTQLLIEDINRLRKHAGIKGSAILFGGSWGTTLALAYAEAWPDLVCGLVLRGVFLGTKAEIDHFYHGGTADFFPENFKKLQSVLPDPAKKNYPEQLFAMCQSKDPALREKAIKGWAYYEIRMCFLDMTDEDCGKIIEMYDMTPFSVLENHYMMHNCFLKEGQLLNNIDKIAHIPSTIVNGRFDVICPPKTAALLASKIKTVKIEFPVAGHSQNEPGNTKALVKGIKWLRKQIE